MGEITPLFPADDARAVTYARRQLGNMEAAMIQSGTPAPRARDILGTAMVRQLAAIIDADPDPTAARARFEGELASLLAPPIELPKSLRPAHSLWTPWRSR